MPTWESEAKEELSLMPTLGSGEQDGDYRKKGQSGPRVVRTVLGMLKRPWGTSGGRWGLREKAGLRQGLGLTGVEVEGKMKRVAKITQCMNQGENVGTTNL